MTPVNDRPILPQAIPATFQGVVSSFGVLIKALYDMASNFGFRLNGVLPKDGSEPMTNPLPLSTVTIATLPTAADWDGAIVYVSDGAVGEKFRGSDGSAWVNLG